MDSQLERVMTVSLNHLEPMTSRGTTQGIKDIYASEGRNKGYGRKRRLMTRIEQIHNCIGRCIQTVCAARVIRPIKLLQFVNFSQNILKDEIEESR